MPPYGEAPYSSLEEISLGENTSVIKHVLEHAAIFTQKLWVPYGPIVVFEHWVTELYYLGPYRSRHLTLL